MSALNTTPSRGQNLFFQPALAILVLAILAVSVQPIARQAIKKSAPVAPAQPSSTRPAAPRPPRQPWKGFPPLPPHVPQQVQDEYEKLVGVIKQAGIWSRTWGENGVSRAIILKTAEGDYVVYTNSLRYTRNLWGDSEVIRNINLLGIQKYAASSVEVQPFLQNRGIGSAIWKLAEYEFAVTNPGMARLVINSSVPEGWTEYNMTEVFRFLTDLGFKVHLLATEEGQWWLFNTTMP